MKKIHKLEEVFTPCQPAHLTYIERQTQKRLLDRASYIQVSNATF
jgi:hypothetical protein